MEIVNNTFKVLICSDTHLGAFEKSPSLHEDCYLAFEEILQQAQQEDVDFIIHSGDFFNDQNPSKYCLARTMGLMRKYLMGKPKDSFDVAYTYDKDEDVAFSTSQGIRLPMYVIHGNHDLPSGSEHVAGLDILQTAGLVNFIGRDDENSRTDKETEEVTLHLSPIIFIKGNTKIALYGMSYKKNEEMYKLWANSQVQIEEPDGDFFKILLIHQDRVFRNSLTTFPEEMLKERFDLVVFGHEHLCQIDEGAGVKTIETGSPFPLSICEFEKAEKFIGLADITGMEINMHKIALRNVREVFYEVITMNDAIEGSANLREVENYIRDEVGTFFDKVGAHEKSMLPLARIIIEYKNLKCTPNIRKLSFDFEKNNINKGDCIKLKKKVVVKREKKSLIKTTDMIGIDFDDDLMDEDVDEDVLARRKAAEIETYMAREFASKDISTIPVKAIERMIENIGNQELNQQHGFDVLVQYYIDKNVEQALVLKRENRNRAIGELVKESAELVKNENLDDEELEQIEKRLNEEQKNGGKKRVVRKNVIKKSTTSKKKKSKKKVIDIESEEEEEDKEEVVENKAPIVKKITKKSKKVATKQDKVLAKLKGKEEL